MKRALLPGIVVLAVVIASATSRSQSSEEPVTGSDVADPEPITGSASVPLGGSELRDRKQPFEPYAAPDPWPYEALSADEQQVVDHGAADEQSATNDAYAAATKVVAKRAAANAAAIQLGVDNLETTGVVP